MSLLNPSTLILTHSLALLPISYYLLTRPPLITDQNLIFILGEAMALPHPPTSLFSTPNPATAIIALLLILNALTDLSSSFSLGEEEAHMYWRSAVPVRLGFFFAVTGASYLGVRGKGKEEEGWKGGVCNSLVFGWGFLEMVYWFWVFILLREEGKVRARRKAVERKRKVEEVVEGG